MTPANMANIPPVLIQTGKSRDLPPLARAAAVNLKLLHPDWEYMFFDDADVARFIRDEFPGYCAVFESFPYRIQRFDFFRYLAVLRHGGFYFDLDVFLSECITELRPQGCVFPFEELTLNRYLRREYGIDWEIGNYAFGAAPGHPFIAAIVENCVRAQRDRRWAEHMLAGIPAPFRSRFHVLNTTGPGLVTRTLAEQGDAAKGVAVLYPDNVCDSREWHRFGRYGVHLMQATWRDNGSFISRKAALLWERWTRRSLLAESQARGHSRSLPLPRTA